MIGKFKFRTLLVLAASVLLASCSQDEVMTDTGHDGLVPVTLSVAVGDGVQTRTASADNDEDAKYCYVQVCQSDGTAYTGNDYATPIALTDDDNDGKFTGNIFLKPGEDYVFLFWADNVTNTAPADLHSVAYQKESIAFADRVEQTISLNAPTVNATLQHVVAKVTLKTTTNVEAGSEITVTVPTTYTAYNVEDEAPITEATDIAFDHTVTSAITGTTDGAEVFSFYALVDEANQDLTLANGTNSQQVTNVPLAPNKHTTLVGDVRNLGLTNVTFTANVVGDWGSTETEIIGLEIADDGTYIVSSSAALQAWAKEAQSNPSLNCTLADNITLPEVADNESNWTTVENFTGTFDGNGKTITGLTSIGGLIGEIGSGGIVQNLKLEDVMITEGGMVGAIAGKNSGTVTGCSVQGSVTGNSDPSISAEQCVGGIVGFNNGNSTVIDCSMKGTVTNSNFYTGGIVGQNNGGNVINCHSSAAITSTNYVGGVVGGQYETNANAKVIACSSTGDVTATSTEMESKAGGVVGFSNGGDIICCYATGNISGKSSSVGGVVGTNRDNVVACYYANGNISGDNAVGGVVGENRTGGIITACYWSDYVGNGIGTGATNVDEATKVDGDWTEVVSKMNSVLEDYDWLWTIESPNTLPTLKKKETN